MGNKIPPGKILKLLAEEKSVSSVIKKIPGLKEKDIWDAVSLAASIMETDSPGESGKYKIKIDGAAIPNPGPAGIGVIIYNPDNKKIKEVKKYIGHASNNVAEYTSLIEGLKEVSKLARNVDVFSDSQLLVNQMKGNYRVKDKKLRELFIEAKTLEKKFDQVVYHQVPREKNKQADQLANIAINLKA